MLNSDMGTNIATDIILENTFKINYVKELIYNVFIRKILMMTRYNHELNHSIDTQK